MTKIWSFLGLLALVAGANCLYSSTSDVVELTSKNFNELVIKGDEIWVVEFYAPWCGHCKQFAPDVEKAAKALKGVVKVGGIDADKHSNLVQSYAVQGFPTVKIFGESKYKPEDYNGARNAEGIVDAALKAVEKKVRNALGGKKYDSKRDSKSDSKSNDVVELTDDNFKKLVLDSEDMWLVEFYAPWCGHCKNLAPIWAKAATELKGKVKLGALDATVNKERASFYDIRGYPTIKYFAPGKKDSDSVSEYDGGRKTEDIVSWAMDKFSENIPAPEVLEIVNEEALKKACEDKRLCVISVLPHILDCQSSCRNTYLNTLRESAEKFKKQMWGWAWAEAGAQSSVEEALEIGGFGYPALAVVNMKKMKYSLLRGSFSKEGINEFLRDLQYGKGSTAPLKGAELPRVNKIVPWDGKDAEPPQEEDIDLSDVVFDEKDEL